jgi:hypothetical protein
MQAVNVVTIRYTRPHRPTHRHVLRLFDALLGVGEVAAGLDCPPAGRLDMKPAVTHKISTNTGTADTLQV